MPLTNRELAELLALESGRHDGNKAKAARRASRHALTWPEEVADMLLEGRDITDLSSVGPWVAGLIQEWLAQDVEVDLDDAHALRRDFLTMAEARRILAQNPEWREIRCDLQMHTTHSDGSLTIYEMAVAAEPFGYEHIGITDHSKGLAIAGGMTEEQLRMQSLEIEQVNAQLENEDRDIRVLPAIEMNISPTGEGDMDPESLRGLAYVLGSFHSQLRKKEDQTDRYLAAIRNPDIQILGHPRGRMWNYRLGLQADWDKVFAAAAELDKAVEIDAHYNRQDLNVELLEVAREAGVRISIGTDAHYQHELLHIDIGLAAAIKAGIPRERVLNFLTAEELITWAEEARAA